MNKILRKYCLFIFVIVCLSNGYAQSTIAPIFQCAQTQINGDVVLTWSPSLEACGPFVNYTIYASNNIAGPYAILTTIVSVASSTFTHVGANGNTTVWYYYIEANYACAGYTITLTDTLDNLDPVAPNLNYVSVLPAGVQINWYPSTSAETNSYIIYRDNGGFNPIATVYGRFTTTFIDASALPDTKVETYTIAARDSCDNIGPFNNDSHHTILLNVLQVNCTNQLNLSWNLYDTWAVGASSYEVWVDKNSIGAILETSLAASTTNYCYTSFADGDVVCITIHAIRADGTAIAFSNTFCQTIQVITQAQYTVARNATVANNTQIDLAYYPDATADLEKYVIRRSLDNSIFANVISTAFGGPIPIIATYNDLDVNTTAHSYYYTFTTIDSCETEKTSGSVRTILLKGNDNANFTNTLNWNAFEMTNATVTNYTIYRDEGAGYNLIATFGPFTFLYDDDVTSFVNIVNTFCYKIECIYQLNAPENGVNEQLISNSNSICVEQGPRIYVPNVIVPKGLNSIFKPVIVYGETVGYTMQIFNRYAQIIFETNDINAGWDGTYKNEIVAMGTYAYLISFTALSGQVITKKGNVTVVR